MDRALMLQNPEEIELNIAIQPFQGFRASKELSPEFAFGAIPFKSLRDFLILRIAATLTLPFFPHFFGK